MRIDRAACFDPQRHLLKTGNDCVLVEQEQFQCIGHRFVAVSHEASSLIELKEDRSSIRDWWLSRWVVLLSEGGARSTCVGHWRL